MRTNSQKVANLIPTEDPYISVAIGAANALVTNKLSDFDLSESLLTEIETYLAAHFLAQNPSIREETGIEFMEYRKGLENTNYGQTAISLDTTNTLASMNKNTGFEFKVL